MDSEKDIRQFLKKMVNTIFIIVFWMMMNVIFGIYYQYAFIDAVPVWQNAVYYVLSLIGLMVVIIFVKRTWAKKTEQ
jgi:hypothetical protein